MERRHFSLLLTLLIIAFSVATLVVSHDRWTVVFSLIIAFAGAVEAVRCALSLRADRSRPDGQERLHD